jgi:1,4-dihydroxy-2-naphthoate octaprenyltransferase
LLHTIRVWLIATRPVSFTAAVVPITVGTLLAAEGSFSLLRFLLALVGGVAIQAGTNLVNDYYDHVKGVDSPDSLSPSPMLQRGVLSPRAVFAGGIAAFVLGSALGLVLVAMVGWPLLVLGVASVLAGFFYTAGPKALAYVGLGEVTAFTFMGPAMVMGAYYVQVQYWGWEPLLVSLPIGLLVAGILHANNLRDLDHDAVHGKRTLATILGRSLGNLEFGVLLLGSYLALVVAVVTGAAPYPALVPLITLPVAVRLVRAAARLRDPLQLNRVLAGTALLHLQFGALLALSLGAALLL